MSLLLVCPLSHRTFIQQVNIECRTPLVSYQDFFTRNNDRQIRPLHSWFWIVNWIVVARVLLDVLDGCLFCLSWHWLHWVTFRGWILMIWHRFRIQGVSILSRYLSQFLLLLFDLRSSWLNKSHPCSNLCNRSYVDIPLASSFTDNLKRKRHNIPQLHYQNLYNDE